MPKIKTHKATAKRFALTKTNKVKFRKPGQDHFNARDTGNEGRKKRTDLIAKPTYVKTIRTLVQE